MPAKVADASVIGAITFGEPEAEKALSLLDNAELYEPSLLAYELASIARKKTLQHPEQADDIARALSLSLALDVTWLDVDQNEILRLALETGLTTYDASYLYLARTLGVPLVTFDEQLRRAEHIVS